MATTKLSDIASALGLSTATISNALTGKGRMKEETRQHIRQTALEMGYVLPAHLKEQRAQLMILTEAVEVEFCGQILRGITSAARDAQVGCAIHDLGIFTTDLGRNATVERLRPLIDDCLRKSPAEPAALVYLAQYPRSLHGLLADLPCPCVALFCEDKSAAVSINYDDQQGAYLAVSHLIADGRKSIAMISGPVESHSVSERMVGYQRALIDNGLPYHPRLVWIGDWEVSSGKALTENLLQATSRPDAIFAQNDVMAMGAIEAIHEAGLRVPEDIAVIGFDNTYYGNFTFPLLTSVAPPFHEMGARAVAAALDLLQGETPQQKSMLIPCTLHFRQSA